MGYSEPIMKYKSINISQLVVFIAVLSLSRVMKSILAIIVCIRVLNTK